MTEHAWLENSDVASMIQLLGKKAGKRKRRLFACACVRRIWHLLDDCRSRRAVEVAEAFADGMVDKETAMRAQREAASASRLTPKDGWYAADAAAICLLQSIEDIATAVRAADSASQAGVRLTAEREVQVSLLRDIFGNPFRPATFDPRWLSSTVRDLAQVIYDERVFERMPVLADALMDAGCDSDEIIKHCQGPGPHVRGCWVVDLLLDKKRAP